MSITEADSATTAETDFVPVIPGCTPNKYYRVPDGLKSLRTKRKVAIVFGYVGERYCGLQWNHLPDYPTIEEALMTALFETDMISRVNMANVKVQQLLNFERASRTDKGVHALCNVVSVALMLPYHPGYVAAQQAQLHATNTNTNQSGEEGEHGEKKDSNADDESEGTYSCAEAKRLLNLALPPAIHVFDVVPVTRSFNAYLCCGGRKYEYYLPTFALLSKNEYLRYFPSSLAPSQPSLQEVGFVPSANSMCVTGPTRTRQRDEEEDGAPRNNNNTSTSGRKSKGHFPKRKNRRVDVPSSAACVGNIEAPEDENSSSPSTTSAEASSNTTSEPPTSLSSTNVVAKHEEDVGAEGTAAAVSDATALKDDFLDLSTKHATHFHDGLFESMILFREIPHDAMARAATYRIAHDHLEYIRGLFHAYEGTHSFHNFTPGGRGTDASCHRFIRSIEVSDPFLVQPDSAMLAEAMEAWSPSRFFAPDESIARWYAEQLSSCEEADHPLLEEEKERRLRDRMRDHMKKIYSSGIEVVRVELHGQSFMLNQIRKMIGAVICMSACGMDASHVQNHLLKKGVRRGIPMAPANGLFLSYLDFSGYNSRLARIQRDGNNGSGKDGLDVARIPDEELEVQRQHIIATILRNEMAEDVMGKWMRSLRHVLRLAWVVDLP